MNYESSAVYPEQVISGQGILHLQQCEVLLQNMFTWQRISLLESMTETIKILLDSYEDLLWVQEHLAICYSILERSLWLSYGQHGIKWCQQFMANQLTVIDKMLKTPQCKALYVTMMNVMHKADCEQPLAMINVMNHIARVFGYWRLASGLYHRSTRTCSK